MNTIPLSKVKFLRFWERIVVVLNPPLFVLTTFTVIWYKRNPDFLKAQKVVLILLCGVLCIEFVRQWFSFFMLPEFSGLSKENVIMLAIFAFVIATGTILAKFSPDTELINTYFFLIIVLIVEIHFVLVLIYLLRVWREKKIGVSS